MSRTKKLDLIKSCYRLAALIILISININTLSAQTAGVVRKKGGPKGKGTQIGTTSTTPTQNTMHNTDNNKGKPSIELQKAMESMQAEKAKEVATPIQNKGLDTNNNKGKPMKPSIDKKNGLKVKNQVAIPFNYLII